jgi:phosphoglycolate phosphatase
LRYQLIVFDWDGTLLDSASAIAECIQLAAADMSLPVPDRERASHVIGLGLEDSLRHAVPTLAESGYGEFIEHYRKHFRAREEAMRLFPGVPELLQELGGRGHRLAVATGKSRRGLDRAFATTGLRPLFAASRCGDETRPKPDPTMLRELLKELAVEARAALMIGDTSHDLQMAANAGIDSVAVTCGAHGADFLRSFSPRACLPNVTELPAWLLKNA